MVGAVVGTASFICKDGIVNGNATVVYDAVLVGFAHRGAGVQLGGSVKVSFSVWLQAVHSFGYNLLMTKWEYGSLIILGHPRR